MTETTEKRRNADGKAVKCSDLLCAVKEEYKWVKACIEEMRENPKIYPIDDHYGLPYMLTILESIAKKANVNLDT